MARPPGALLVLALALELALLVPCARAGCAIAKIEDTNFVSQPVKGMGPSKVCFTIATQACTNASAPCCFASPPPIKSVMLSGVSSKCSGGKAIRGLSVSVDGGTPTRASRGPVSGGINLRLKGAAPGQQICVELSAATSPCNTIDGLCVGDCGLVLVTKPAKGSAAKRAYSCCATGTTAASPYNIKLVNVGTSKALDPFFAAAVERWTSIIRIDLPDVTDDYDKSNGMFPGFKYTDPVDDLVIFYRLTEIDGVGNTLGSADAIFGRKDGTSLPISGYMNFDIADFNADPTPSSWKNIITHEVGHVLGLGGLWERRGCRAAGCTAGSGAAQPYLCKNARAQYNALGCPGDLPIETSFKTGSDCFHWKESVLLSELMTPSTEGAGQPMPLSVVTIGAIEDLYGPGSVDYSKADPWNCTSGYPPTSLASAQGRVIATINRGDMREVPVAGRPVREAQHSSVDAAFVAELAARGSAAP